MSQSNSNFGYVSILPDPMIQFEESRRWREEQNKLMDTINNARENIHSIVQANIVNAPYYAGKINWGIKK
jgi:hypothetical protein